jgi:hypothetical protein
MLGSSIEPTHNEKRTFFPGNFKRAKAYPQSVAVEVPKTTAGTMIVIVLLKYLRKGKFSRVAG